MMYYRNMNHDQIAEELNLTKDALYSRLRRTKAWIQQNYKEEFENIKKEYL